MALSLSNLRPAKGAVKRRLIVGRGGKRGTFSGRGTKGQRARSGGSKGLKAMGFRQTLQRIPKSRGFTSFKPKMAVVNVADLEKNFNANDSVDFRGVIKLGLADNSRRGLKILGDGALTKKLRVVANAFSVSAKKAIEAAGGEVVLLTKEPKVKLEKPQHQTKEVK